MRRTRFMSVLFLMLSAAFFCLPQFRQAFTLPILLRGYQDGEVSKLATVSESQFQQWTSEAEAGRDARALAFVALHSPDAKQRARLADLAVSLDPELGWVCMSLISMSGNRKSQETLAWAKKLQQFEPGNALGYLQEAEYLRENDPILAASGNAGMPNIEELLKQTEWRTAMKKAFAAPRYESYNLRRFELERKFMREHGLATPASMLPYISAYPIPNLLNIRQYANLMVNKVGKDAEKAGRTKEALKHYWTVAHFGERLQLGAASLIEHLIAVAVQKIAYQPLESLLRSSGQADAAMTVDYASAEILQRVDAISGNDILAMSSNKVWNALIAYVFLALVMIFSMLTVISMFYVNAKRRIWTHKHGKTNDTKIAAENYLPVLLFASCAGLYISYYPYARNFQHYINARGNLRDLQWVFENSLTITNIIPAQHLSLGNSFVPYGWYALAGFAIALLVAFLGQRTEKSKDARAQLAGRAQ